MAPRSRGPVEYRVVADPPVGDEDGEEMVSKGLVITCVVAVLWALPASATDTVTSSTVSSTVSSSSNTVSTSSGNTVIDKAPATANSPSVVINNSDICVTGVSGAVQTSLFGVSGGGTVRDKNCEILKLSRTLYGAGLKVAAVSLLCQDARVFDAMMSAGTPCPFDGKIGDTAKNLWLASPDEAPEGTKLRRTSELFKQRTIVQDALDNPDEYPE